MIEEKNSPAVTAGLNTGGMKSPPGPIGAAMVVGGGIGGMQAALDLAESGIKVYLVDNGPCLGGVMAQLDKTFPTNDCAMCTMAPKLVEVGRHKDIEIVTFSDIDKIEGGPGHFKVKLRKRARYIDEDKCTGCGECTEKCPVTIPDSYNESLSEQKAIYRRYPQAIPNYFAINKLGQSPCRSACPAEQKAQGYIALIREKRYEEAYRVITRDNPFPSVCGRICNHRCEDECTRGKVDEPVSIMALKRFVADWAFKNKIGPGSPGNGEEASPAGAAGRVAIIGSGPAGLTAAKDLSGCGYGVTVFEALPVAGGMMTVGIPAFRLPRERLEWDIANIFTDGIKLKTNSRVKSIDILLQDGYRAVFIATGTSAGKIIPIPGSDLPDVLINTDFLREVALGKKVAVGKTTMVLGGGNVALDVARTALRCGAKKVRVSCLESREKMPAHSWEIEDAEKEGIEIYPGRSFLEILSSGGKVTGIRCIEVNFRGFHENGRPDMDPIEGSEHTFAADTVIFAIGQGPEIPFTSEGIELSRRGTVKVDQDTLETSRAGVFAGGDVVTGTQFVVDAISAGHKAAISIDRYLKGEELRQPETDIYTVRLNASEIAEKMTSRTGRQPMPVLPQGERKGFEEIELGYDEEEALSEANRCLKCSICSECFLCVETCKADAVNHLMERETFRQIEVGAIIFSPGFESFDPGQKLEYGYSKYPNVITALEFERILSATGPYKGRVLRPSDQAPPRKIAFIQCVGSREERREYCSSICCMYATKEAIIAKEHSPDPLECHVYYMDLRAFGKGFDAYYNRARELGVKYIRSRPSDVEEMAGTGNLLVKYVSEEGEIKRAGYDLVILSTGVMPPASAKEIRNKAGVRLNKYGFCRTADFSPLDTTRKGVFACGPFTGPKDIPETVTEASAAASRALSLLSDARGTMITKKEYPPEKSVFGQEPRIGVFVCHCGVNIGGVVNVPEVVEYAKTLPNVAYAEHNLYTCSNDTQTKISGIIEEHNLNRVIVSSCTPRTHEPLFRNTLREAGLNPYLFEMANIRDQCSWVHAHEPDQATEKAKNLVGMAVAKARLLAPLHKIKVDINHSALVIGGGLSGLTAALAIAEQGFKVHLVERERELGGHLRRIRFMLAGEDPREKLASLIERVKGNDLVQIYQEMEVANIEGFLGNFKTTLAPVNCDPERGNGKANLEIEHGVVIVATGAEEYKPVEYLWGKDERILTQLEFEEKLASGENPEAETVVMIQCVGSRDEERPYCSRVCCSQAVKNALKLKEINPAAEVFILTRDVRTYGFSEAWYKRARESGVIFLRYNDDEKPRVFIDEGHPKVSFEDSLLKKEMVLEPDLIVLSAAIVPRTGNIELAKKLKISLTQENFFLEAHIKLRPSDFSAEGFFVAGLAHSPKTIAESITQGQAVAARAATIISKDKYEAEATIAAVNEDICAGCGVCVSICEYDALEVVERLDGTRVSKLNEVLCKGCGACGAACPRSAIGQKGFNTEQVLAMVDAALA